MSIPQRLCTKVGVEVAPFWGKEDLLSNHFVSERQFKLDSEHFNCTEQFFMLHKALIFGDEPVAELVLATPDPVRMKSLGRRVKNFDGALWQRLSPIVMVIANHAKFHQNEPFKRALLATEGAHLVEASPLDKLWGAGLAQNDARLLEGPHAWPGRNLMGEVLMCVRDHLGQSADTTVVNAHRDEQLRSILGDMLRNLTSLVDDGNTTVREFIRSAANNC